MILIYRVFLDDEAENLGFEGYQSRSHSHSRNVHETWWQSCHVYMSVRTRLNEKKVQPPIPIANATSRMRIKKKADLGKFRWSCYTPSTHSWRFTTWEPQISGSAPQPPSQQSRLQYKKKSFPELVGCGNPINGAAKKIQLRYTLLTV